MTVRPRARRHAPDQAIDWLLSSKEPSVRYLTLTEVLGESPRSAAVRAARAEIPDGARVRGLFRGQRPDGGFGVHPYRKWRGAHWRLVSLVELAVPAEDARARAAADQVLAWLLSPSHRRSIPVIAGRPRRCASQEGNALAVCCRLGMGRDPRVRALAELLQWAQWPDGGWNCDPRAQASHSSFYESITPLWGLSEFAHETDDADAHAAAERAAEFFLRHRLFRSCSDGHVPNPRWLELHYPLYWHYDVLHGLLIISRCGKVRDPRAAEALDVVARKRGEDGLWRPEAYYWRPRRSRDRGRGADVVDWGRGRPNEMLTLNAMRVLRAAGRL